MALNHSLVPGPNRVEVTNDWYIMHIIFMHSPMGPGTIPVFAVSSRGSQGPKFSSSGQRTRMIRVFTGRMSFCWFCRAQAQIYNKLSLAVLKTLGY